MRLTIVSPLSLASSLPTEDGTPKRNGTTVISSWTTALGAIVGGEYKEPKHEKLAREAEAAEKQYKEAVEQLDRTRLFLEEKISDHLLYMQRLEVSYCHLLTLPKLISPNRIVV